MREYAHTSLVTAGQRRVAWVDAESDHMHGQTGPGDRNFDSRYEADAGLAHAPGQQQPLAERPSDAALRRRNPVVELRDVERGRHHQRAGCAGRPVAVFHRAPQAAEHSGRRERIGRRFVTAVASPQRLRVLRVLRGRGRHAPELHARLLADLLPDRVVDEQIGDDRIGGPPRVGKRDAADEQVRLRRAAARVPAVRIREHAGEARAVDPGGHRFRRIDMRPGAGSLKSEV